MPDGIIGLIIRALPIIVDIAQVVLIGYVLYQSTQPQTQQVSIQTTSINDIVQQFIPLVMLMMTIFLVFTMFKNIF